MKTVLAVLAAIAAGLIPSPALADFPTFVVDQLYSSADGEIQFIVLRENAGAAGQNQFASHAVTSTHAGVVKTFVFPSNLPSSATAGRHVLMASDGYVALRASSFPNLPAPDYTFPNRFLATDGGAVNLAGVDQLTYAALPTDGTNARYRDGTATANQAQNFAGALARVPGVYRLAVEYYTRCSTTIS